MASGRIKGITIEIDGDTPVISTDVPIRQEKLVITGLPYGHYYITTTTGTAVAVTTTDPDTEVVDKNVVPTLGLMSQSSMYEN